MEIFKQIAPLKAFLKDLKCQGKSVGLVPTMGALHDGHLSLFRACQAENQLTVGSIFVNPIQFNNPSDLVNYPRTLARDTELLRAVGCDVLFNPENSEMYPEKNSVTLDFGHLGRVMEGEYRPGHFSGVAIVVSKLFNIVAPDHAYFGQKDWQQFTVIKKLTEEMNFNIRLHSVSTFRDTDGLAMSSRNLRLAPAERAKANVFYRGLLHAQDGLRQGHPLAEVKAGVQELINSVPGVRLEYLELADSENLNLLDRVDQSAKPILCIAGYVGEVRLIDNMFIIANS